MGARPSKVKKVIRVGLPRPRDTNASACIAIRRQIEACMEQEFHEPSADELTRSPERLIRDELK